jgi:hypothetical protein
LFVRWSFFGGYSGIFGWIFWNFSAINSKVFQLNIFVFSGEYFLEFLGAKEYSISKSNFGAFNWYFRNFQP